MLSVEAMVGGGSHPTRSEKEEAGGCSARKKEQKFRGNAPQVPACLALAPSLVTDSGTYHAAEPACTSQTSSFSPERRVDVSQVGSLGGGWCSLPLLPETNRLKVLGLGRPQGAFKMMGMR